jgi:Leucine-rich repeat (LRR) protein
MWGCLPFTTALTEHALHGFRTEQKMPNLEVLSLSANKIISLQSFSHCAKLQELYLRKNAVQLPHQSSVRLHQMLCSASLDWV